MDDFLTALGLVFIIEGLVLFISPKKLVRILNLISLYSEKKIRLIGSISIIIGILFLWLIRK